MTMKCLIPVLIFLTIVPVLGQDYTADSTFDAIDTLRQDFGIFDSKELLHIALRFDISEYIRKRPRDHYIDALLTYYINDHDSVNRQIRLKSRGIFRNGYCAFPPLSISLCTDDTTGNKGGKTEKIKVVTHCRTGNEVYLFKEYLVYKLLNILTDYSFRVRLAKIEYINTGKRSKTISTYCFFIEPIGRLTERTNTVPVNSTTLRQQNWTLQDRGGFYKSIA
jgi:hypothetical protein